MMKSFFKKLAFVMALAMVVSLAAPAAAKAVAANELKIAYQNGSAISEVNLAKVGDTEDLKFTGAPDYKEAGFEWISSNPAVATVDKAGVVTAVAAGTANVTIKIGTDREATVVVNVVNLPTYTATMGTSRDNLMTAAELEIGEVIDLAFFGIKDYDAKRYSCIWFSVDPTVATVDQKGLITAVAEGKTVITLGVLNLLTGKQHAVQSCVVTVKGEEPVATATPTATPAPVVDKDAFTVVQKDTDKFVFTFEVEKTVEEIRENLTVSVKIGDKNYPISFENITIDGKTVTVTTYARFENGEVYTLTYGEHEVEDYTIVLGEIAEVGLTYYTGKNKDNNVAYVMEEVEDNDFVTFVPVLFDTYGNDVTAKYDLTNFDFTYDITGNVDVSRINNDVFAFGAAGTAVVNITATWIDSEGMLQTATGKTAIPVVKHAQVVVTLEKAGIVDFNITKTDENPYPTNVNKLKDDNRYTYENSALTSFQLDPYSAVWNHKPATTFEYWTNDARELVYTAVLKDNRGNVFTSNADDYKFGTFSYESTNNEVLTISDNGGEVELLKVGTANILVYFTPADGTSAKKLVGSTRVTVTPETYPVRFEVTTPSLTAASHVIDEDLNNVDFVITFYDQFGDVYDGYYAADIAGLLTIEARDTNNKISRATARYADGVYKVAFDGSSFKEELATIAGTSGALVATTLNNSKKYSYKVTLEKSDITKHVATQYGVFSLNVENTAKDYVVLDQFLTDGILSDDNKNYKFNISIDKSKSVDLAVKYVEGYTYLKAEGLEKSAEFKAKYLSNAGTALAYIPEDMFLPHDTTTGNAGYVYYKVSVPSKAAFEGTTIENAKGTLWKYNITDGKVTFTFNQKDSEFKYAATGAYSMSYATTRTNNGTLYNVGSSTVSVSNTQAPVKYDGLNPELGGVTELDITNVAGIIEEQLLFSYGEIVFGEYYDEANAWDETRYPEVVKLVLNHEKSNVTPSKDGKSLIISTLVFDVIVDDVTGSYTTKYIVSVGARIKVK